MGTSVYTVLTLYADNTGSRSSHQDPTSSGSSSAGGNSAPEHHAERRQIIRRREGPLRKNLHHGGVGEQHKELGCILEAGPDSPLQLGLADARSDLGPGLGEPILLLLITKCRIHLPVGSAGRPSPQ